MFGKISWGDTITAVNGKRVRNEKDLFAALDNCRPGQTVDVTLQKNNETPRTVKVTLSDRKVAIGE